MPKISVIMPVYNSEKYLRSSIDSIVSQDFADLELICVNDGSSDDSLKILEGYRLRDERVKVITQKNSGGSAARNVAIKEASGEFLMFLDSDDLYADGIISRVYKRAVDSGADVVLYNFSRFINKPNPLAIKSSIMPDRDIEFVTKEGYSERLFNDFATITWNKIVKRKLVADNNLLFNEGLSHNHDVDFSVRLMLSAASFSWLNEVGYYYRDNENGLTATKRSDPLNVLRILGNLNGKVESEGQQVKRSFDNYVLDMISGTLEKYRLDKDKQKMIFDYTKKTLIPQLHLDMREQDYFFAESTYIFLLIRDGQYRDYVLNSNSIKRRLRRFLKTVYNVCQSLISRFAV